MPYEHSKLNTLSLDEFIFLFALFFYLMNDKKEAEKD